MIDTIKQFLIQLYYRKGRQVGIHLLKSLGISVALVVVLNWISKTPISVGNICGWIVALPLISVIISLFRAVIGLVHVVVPMNPGPVKFLFDFVVFSVIIMALGFLFRNIQVPDSELLQTVLTLTFDAAYIATIIFCMRAGNNDE